MDPASHRRAVRPRSLADRPAAVTAAFALVLGAGACAPERDDDLFGMNLEVQSQQAWASDPELRPRLHALIEESCAYMGLDPATLYGMTLRIEDEAIDCGTVEGARGCTWRSAGVIVVSTIPRTSGLPRVPCVEDTPIPHELLHVKIGDVNHTDPRWYSAGFWNSLGSSASRDDCSGVSATFLWGE